MTHIEKQTSATYQLHLTPSTIQSFFFVFHGKALYAVQDLYRILVNLSPVYWSLNLQTNTLYTLQFDHEILLYGTWDSSSSYQEPVIESYSSSRTQIPVTKHFQKFSVCLSDQDEIMFNESHYHLRGACFESQSVTRCHNRVLRTISLVPQGYFRDSTRMNALNNTWPFCKMTLSNSPSQSSYHI